MQVSDGERHAFQIVAREAGADGALLPVWASKAPNPAGLAAVPPGPVAVREVAAVPGVRQLLGVLAPSECRRLVALTEALGYAPDAAVSLPRSVRHNDNLVWLADDATLEILWHRLARPLAAAVAGIAPPPLALNGRLRFYRYRRGDYFAFHRDGAWTGSRLRDGRPVADAFGGRTSRMTVLFYLNDDFAGGATRFLVDGGAVDVRTPAGGVLLFPHGDHPLHRLHASLPVERGVKYILRTDLLCADT
ncbi:MAG: hypothetical protein KatS3mg124_0590 [Porticoccaceae bacterium]|nr:MAG: hypothetical protein KatS3mg124_0590 [Porticoccaceae bacterium]